MQISVNDRKAAALLLAVLLLLRSLTACGGQTEGDEEMPAMNTPPPEDPVLMEITVTAGETVLEGILFDNETARAVSAMLPLAVDLWHPARGFARAFDLPEQISDTAERTRNYERGGLAHWYEGPSVAIFYSGHLAQTIVEVVTIAELQPDAVIYDNALVLSRNDVASSGDNVKAWITDIFTNE